MYDEISSCRVCANSNLLQVMDLGCMALTGVFPRELNEDVASGPVQLVLCDGATGCGLVQLRQSYSLESMYGMNYGYRSGLNASMVAHLESKVESIIALGILEPGDLVIDIGSNDATTLKAYPQEIYRLVGIDPTGVKFSEYYPSSITLLPDFFSKDLILSSVGEEKAKVITSFSMFYDLEDPVGFAKEVERVLHPEGVWVLEQSYLPAMLKTNSFDTVCHEHLEFYALQQIKYICSKAGLRIIDVDFNDVNGGSFSIVVAKSDSSHMSNLPKISQVLENEEELGIGKVDPWLQFGDRVEAAKVEFMEFLKQAQARGESVLALGASTKGNVLLQYFGLSSNQLPAIGEVNEDKFGSYTPATLIPIISQQDLLKRDPDYIVILPWHFKKFFLSLEKLRGRKLVFPLPKLEVVEV